MSCTLLHHNMVPLTKKDELHFSASDRFMPHLKVSHQLSASKAQQSLSCVNKTIAKEARKGVGPA